MLVGVPTNVQAQAPRENDAQESDSEEQPRGEARQQLPLDERLRILEQELESVRLQKATRTYESYAGMGPAASGVYYADQGLSWGGYGEIVGTDFQSEFRQDETDALRLILYAGYRFNDWIVLNSEIEYEHAGFEEVEVTGDVDPATGEPTTETINESGAKIEMAYVEFEFAKEARLSVGLNLVPIGITNYMHEPTTFYSVYRPDVETAIIPTTWREMGALLRGDILGETWRYRLGLMTGLRATDFGPFNWIRGGRTQGSEAPAESGAWLANLEYIGYEGLIVGGTYYYGEAGQGEIARLDLLNSRFELSDTLGTSDPFGVIARAEEDFRASDPASVGVHLAEAHFWFENGPWNFRGLAARGWMSEEDTRAVNRQTGLNIGKVVEGAYIEAAYDVLSLFQSRYKMYLFVRNSYVNTHKETVTRSPGGEEDLLDFICGQTGTCQTTGQLRRGNRDIGIIESFDPGRELYGVQGVADRTLDRRIITLGAAFFPEERVVLKLDYQYRTSKSDYHADISGRNRFNFKVNQINFGVGFIF